MFLSDVTVCDWTEGRAGPFAARVLGQFGARVLRIGRPPADEATLDAAVAAYLNAGKSVVGLDPLADPESFAELLAGCQILVETQVSPEARALIDRIRAARPDLAVISMSDYGLTGPAAGWPSSDLTVQHFSGLAHNQARPVQDPATMPPQPGAEHEGPLAAGIAGAAAAIWALMVTESGETAPHADVAVNEFYANVLFESLGEHGAGERAFDRKRKAFKGTEVAGGLIWILPCVDGWVMASPREQHQWDRWIDLLGSPDWARDPDLCGDKMQRKRKWGELQTLMSDWTRTRTREEVFTRAQAARVACFPVSRPDDILANPQLAHRQFFDRMTLGGRTIRVPGIPAIIETSGGERLARGRDRAALAAEAAE